MTISPTARVRVLRQFDNTWKVFSQMDFEDAEPFVRMSSRPTIAMLVDGHDIVLSNTPKVKVAA